MKKRYFSRACAAAALLAVVGTMSGCCEDCEKRAKQWLDLLKAATKIKIRGCCVQPNPADCIQQVTNEVGTIVGIKIPEAMDACRNKDWERLKEIWKEIKDIVPWVKSGATTTASGAIVNELPLLLDHQTIQFAFSAAQSSVHVSKATAYADGVAYTPEAAGVVAAMPPILSDSPGGVIVTQPGDPGSLAFATYDIAGTPAVTIGDGADLTAMTLSGEMEISQFVLLADGSRRALVNSLDWRLTSAGNKAAITLDKTFPYNEVRLGSNNTGVLRVAVAVTDSSVPFIEDVFSQLWIVLPVSVTPDGATLTFDTAGAVAGPTIFPYLTDAYIAELASEGGPCDDANGNGVPDIADDIIGDISEAQEGLCEDEAQQ